MEQLAGGDVLVLSATEVRELMAYADELTGAVIQLVVATGLSHTALVATRWTSIGRRNNRIKLPSGDGTKMEWVPLGRAASAAVRWFRKVRPGRCAILAHPYFFDTRPLPRALRAASVAAGLPELEFRDLQNTWACWYLIQGGSPRRAAAALGISDKALVRKFHEVMPDSPVTRRRRVFALGEFSDSGEATTAPAPPRPRRRRGSATPEFGKVIPFRPVSRT